MTPLDLGSLLLVVWAAMSAGPLLVALARRKRRHAPSVTGLALSGVDVHVVRPCAGLEPELVRSLSSLPEAEGAELRVSFCVERADDPARAAIEAAIEALFERGVRARVVVSHATGPNRKVQQIHAALREPWPDVGDVEAVVVVDSDVLLEGYPLGALVGPIARDGSIAAVWAPPYEAAAPRGLGDRASSAVLGASLHCFSLLCELDPSGLVGKTFAARRSTLMRTVRLAELESYLGEDMELSRRIVASGAGVAVSTLPVRSLAAGRSFVAAVQRYGRWLAVIRAQRPALLVSYPLMFFPLTSIAIAALLLATPLAALAVLLALVVRVGVARAARRATGEPSTLARDAYDAALGELVLALAWARALASRRIAWRQGRMELGRDGRLVPLQS